MSNYSRKFDKQSTLKVFLYCFLAVLILFSAIRISEINLEQTVKNDDYPDLSATEIIISSPENRTYTEPMSGYYPATYSFDDVSDGFDHPEWSDNNRANVIANWDNHMNVYRGIDNNPSTAVDAYNFWISQTYGTIEFWIQFSDNSQGVTYWVQLTGQGVLFGLKVEAGMFYYETIGGGQQIIGAPTPQINEWYHIRYDFRGSHGSIYQGLTSHYTYKISIDRVEYGPYPFVQNYNPDLFHVHTALSASSITTYWDAVGYSWDLDYTIGDNLNEGLLLSFNQGFTSDWLGYSIDGQANRTILGNTTLPFPTQDGVHKLQVFGNNSLGTIYQSDMRYFTTQIFNIVTPENKTYTEPMNGYYPATCGFENDEDGSIPDEWNYILNSGTIEVESQLYDHKKVLKLHDALSAKGMDTRVYNQLSDIGYGTIEVWMLHDNLGSTDNRGVISGIGNNGNNKSCQVMIMGGTTPVFAARDGSNWTPITSASEDTWYHIRIDFEARSFGGYQGLNQYEYYVRIDGIRYGPYSFYYEYEIDEVRLATYSFGSGYNVYFDAIGYSWNSDYSIGDNLNEGLLLSYINSTSLEWMGYCLDGQANRTILGNTTFPFPTQDGVHKLQLFGNNSVGIAYESNIRYFTVDVYLEPPIPYINLITPENRTYTEPMSDLFLSFETNINLDWIAYSLDDQINITITGNKTIPIPADGHHFIQVFGNDTLGIKYESNIQYFTIDTSPPVISGIEIIIELEQYSYYILQWNITDISGGTYSILKNSSLESADIFRSNDVISINVDTTKLGYLNYALIATDLYNKTSSHIVIVKIISQGQQEPMIPGFNVLILYSVALITIGIISKSKFKKKK